MPSLEPSQTDPEARGPDEIEFPEMKIYSCHTASHEVLFQGYFLRTLPENFQSHSTILDIGGTGDFLSRDFLRTIAAKVSLIVASLEDNEGSYILWSDVDIVFTGNPTKIMVELLQSQPEVDLWLQKERLDQADKEANAGFMLMRANPATKHFFQQVQALMAAGPGFNDQEAINKLLHDSGLVVWRYLPPDFYARSHGWPPREKILLYHANCTAGSNGVRQKLKQFSDYRKLQLYGRPFAIYVIFRRKIRKSLSRSMRKFAR